MNSVRGSAAGVLLRLDNRRTTLAAELEAARQGMEDRRDRGLLVELATGTLRWRQELDALIEAASRRDVSTIDPIALAVLRLGAYQLRHLSRVPSHAVVHESVEVVRELGAHRAAGFVNAVLRSLIRHRSSSSLPPRPGPGTSDERILQYLSTTLSHPKWLATRWLKRYGFDATERWCQFNNTAPDLTVRTVSPGTTDALLDSMRREGIEARLAPFVHDAIRLPPGALGRLSAELRDAVVVQDEGAQLVARFAAAKPGERVLDVCASPGGKSLVLATDLGLDHAESGSVLVAADRRPARVRLLAATIRRTRFRIPVLALDALHPLPFGPVFDAVVVDAPCSGLGTLRRDPDVKWTCEEADLPRFAADQLRMLASAAAAVRPGGRLIYATCSSEPEENDDVVRSFLAKQSEFSVGPASFFVTRPFEHGLDAYFAAMLVRRRAA